MDIVNALLTNKVLIAAIAGNFSAQILKWIIEICKGTFSKERFFGGGMPSTHSSTVCAIAAAAFIKDGPNSSAFAIALFMAFIVMYDANGVRLETGMQAKAFNRLRQRDRLEGKEPVTDESMNEIMGHTMPEIIAGIVLGVCMGIVVSLVLPEKIF